MFSGAGAGAVFGKANKTILLLPMTDHGVKMLTADTKYELGIQAGITAGPYGREASLAADAGGKGVGATLSYVFSKGALVNIGYENNFIETVNEVNKAFYGKKASAIDIIFEPGTVDIPEGKGVEELHAKLGELSTK